MGYTDFITYCLGFYGVGGLYPLGMSDQEIQRAIRLYDLISEKALELDSIGREQVRDIVLTMRGTKTTTNWEI